MNKKNMLLTIVIIIIAAILNLVIRVYDLASYKFIIRLLLVIGVVVFIIGATMLLFKKEKSIMVAATTFLIVLLISNYIGIFIINYQHHKIFNLGAHIGVALNKYYETNNKYPQYLEELVPKYIDTIPEIKTTYCDESSFLYYIENSGKSYYLGFEQYYFNGRGWLTND